VVGPQGTPLYIDEHGRVKVQFTWDREGPQNENSSRWVRVAQSRTGRNLATLELPRINEEVLIAFVDGDPDLPVVIGSVYNAANAPPVRLPENGECAGRWSRSSTGQRTEFSFHDRAGEEQIRIATRELILKGDTAIRLSCGDADITLTRDSVSIPQLENRIEALMERIYDLSGQVDEIRKRLSPDRE
jgi:type VI secretion system secreted protein VgrG